MNLLFSILYAPIVFFSLKNFSIETVASFIFVFSAIWLLFTIKKGIKEFFFPLIYLVIAILAFLINDLLFLKIIPFLISLVISSYIFYSYKTNNSFIFIFLEKINKQVEDDEKVYIHKSTLFWFIVSLVNLFIHGYILYLEDIKYWTIYSSFGWYFIFLIAGFIQFIHKKLYFNKGNKC